MRCFERRATAAHGIKRQLRILVSFLGMKCSRDEVALARRMRCPMAFRLPGRPIKRANRTGNDRTGSAVMRLSVFRETLWSVSGPRLPRRFSTPEAGLFLRRSMAKPVPESLPKRGPRCPHCSKRMITTDVSAGPEGFEHWASECPRCGFKKVKIVTCDPMTSDAVGWL
jgi:DNA-directed RNA polymerase subunit RPC12/RpoP